MNLKRTTALVLFVVGLIGLLDSFYLVIEYFHVLTSGGEPTPCSPSSLVNCTKTVQGEWSHVLGVSNPLWGMLWYGMFTMYGYARLTGTEFNKQTRRGVLLLIALGMIFSYTLYVASVIVLRGVCPFCLTSTLASTALLFAFIVDDRLYSDQLVTNKHLPIVRLLQIISLVTYGVGLPLFLAINIPHLVFPMDAITHWSFPLMIVLIALMWLTNWWTYKHTKVVK